MPVMGSLVLYNTIHKTTTAATYTLAYGACTLSLNLIATGFIAGRLLIHRHCIVSQLGRAHGQHYVSITAVVVESAAVHTGFVVIVLVTHSLQRPAKIDVEQMILQVQVSGKRMLQVYHSSHVVSLSPVVSIRD